MHRQSRGRNARERQHGFVTATSVAGVMIISVVAVSTYSLSAGLSNAAGRSAQKIQATQMAESGTNALYAQIVSAFDANPGVPSWPTSIATTPVNRTSGGVTLADGSYTAHLVNTPTAQTTNGTTVYTFVVEGDGTSPDGSVTSQVRNTFTATTVGTGGGSSTYAFPSAALVVNGSVNLSNGAGTVDSSGSHGAGIMANGSVSVAWGSSVDGSILTAVANLNLSQLLCPQALLSALTGTLAIPTGSQVATWTTAWQTSAKSPTGSSPSGSIYTTGNYSGTTTMKAPAYYSGDLNIGYGTTTLQPDTTATAPYVLYVHGNIHVAQGGTLVNNGVVIVCDGTVTIDNGSTYKTTAPSSSALIDLNASATAAVSLGGGANANVGLIYAPNGGMTLNGGVTYTGSLVSGSASASVSLTGGAKVNVSIGLGSTIPIIPNASTVTFAPSAMGSYYRMQ